MPRFFSSLPDATEAASFSHLAIGFFDGLHRGHRAVICGEKSPADLARVCVFTFEPHPIAVLNPEGKPPLITGLPHKLKVLDDWEVGQVLAFPFNLDRSRQDPEAFLHELVSALPFLKSISVGTRWRFGHQRRGDVELLRNYCTKLGIGVEICEPVEAGGEIISSSRLRTIIQAGALGEAENLLGRPFGIFGTVKEGQKLGRTLGIPTANIDTNDECFPPSGVYAGWAVLPDRQRFRASINIGHRPSADHSPQLQIEGHLLDFNGNLYGREILFELHRFLRPEKKFSSLDALKTAILGDIENTRNILS